MVAAGWSLSMLLPTICILNARAWITTTTHGPYALARGNGTAPEAGPWHGAMGFRVRPERAACAAHRRHLHRTPLSSRRLSRRACHRVRQPLAP